MQNTQQKYITQKELKAIFDANPNDDREVIGQEFLDNDYIIEGYNDADYVPPKEKVGIVRQIGASIVKPFENIANTLTDTSAAIGDEVGARIMGTDNKSLSERIQGEGVNRLGKGITSTIDPYQTAETRNLTTTKGLKQTAGDVLSAGSNFVPASKVVKGAGMLAKGTNLALQGAEMGALASGGQSMQEDNNLIDVAKDTAIGAGVGAGTNVALGGLFGAPGAIKKALGKSADGFNNTIIKPGVKEFKYGRNPGETMAKYGITGSTLEEITQNTNTVKNKVANDMQSVADELSSFVNETSRTGKNLSDQSKLLQNKPYSLNINDAFNEIDDGIKSAIKRNNSTLANKLQDIKTALSSNLDAVLNEKTGVYEQVNNGSRDLKNMNFQQAWDLRKEIGSHINFMTETADDLKVNGVVKNLYDAVNKRLDDFAKNVSPEIGKKWKSLNMDYSGLEAVRTAAERRAVAMQKNNIFGGIQTPVAGAGLGAAGIGVGYLTGNDPASSGGYGAMLGMGLSALSKNPTVMTNLAKQTYKLSKKQLEKEGVQLTPSAIQKITEIFLENLRKQASIGASKITTQ